jgi:hypothetical protein
MRCPHLRWRERRVVNLLCCMELCGGKTMEEEDFMQRKASMKEIRVRWLPGLHDDDEGNLLDGGTWFPDAPTTRQELMEIIQAGLDQSGPGSHWLEEREA